MKKVAIAWRYLWSRPVAAALNLLLLSLGLASISFLLLVNHHINQAFERDLAGIDVVVGAKGSPMQLILAGMFHIDGPPGNVPLADIQLLGTPPQRIAGLRLCEALWLAALATALGLLLGQGLSLLISRLLRLDQSILTAGWSWPPELWVVPVLALCVAALSAVLPAREAYKVSVFELLQPR